MWVFGQWRRMAPADKAAHLAARGCLARPQDHGDGAGRRAVIDMDRQEAALVMMTIKQRELLVAVDDIDRIVDIAHDCFGRGGIARTVKIDHDPAEPNEVTQARHVLEPGHGRLARQRRATLRQMPAGELQGRIRPERIEIIGILVATGDGEDAGQQDPGELLRDARRIAPIGDRGGKSLDNADPARGSSQKHHASVRGKSAAIECGCDLPPGDGWKSEGKTRIFGHGGCGGVDGADRIGLSS